MVARNTAKKARYNYREQVDAQVDAPVGGCCAPSLEDQLAAARRRIDELLASNNEYLERARAAEHLANQRLVTLTGQAILIGQLGGELAVLD